MREHLNNVINMIPPKFKCDVELKNVPAPFPNKSFFKIIVGKPGSGKSSLLVNLITRKKKGNMLPIYRKKFNFIYLFCPPSSLKSLSKNPFECLPDDQIYDDFNEETLDDCIDNLEENSEANETSLVIIDDLASSLKEGNRNFQKDFLRLVFNRRHLRVSVILLSQRLFCIPKAVRSVATHIILFPPGNKSEKEIIHKEFIPIPKNSYKKLSNFVWRTKHDTLFHEINSKEFYRNFNKINLSDEELNEFFE